MLESSFDFSGSALEWEEEQDTVHGTWDTVTWEQRHMSFGIQVQSA